jgi:16S rRNA (uracil1498-N3)-methyltransferase
MAKVNSSLTSADHSDASASASEFPPGTDFFYVAPDHVERDYLVVEEDEFNHLTHVMRKRVGDSIVAVDGAGCAYRATIERIERRSARCRIEVRRRDLHEPSLRLTVGIAMLKHPAAMDYVVEKLTELGAGTVIPMVTSRTISRHGKPERWQKLALAAMKQSGRCVLPVVREVTAFSDILARSSPAAARLIPHEATTSPHIAEAITGQEPSAVILIGPEGGFTEAEVADARKGGFVPVTLGERRLRAETAAVVAAAFALRG